MKQTLNFYMNSSINSVILIKAIAIIQKKNKPKFGPYNPSAFDTTFEVIFL